MVRTKGFLVREEVGYSYVFPSEIHNKWMWHTFKKVRMQSHNNEVGKSSPLIFSGNPFLGQHSEWGSAYTLCGQRDST